MIRQGGKLIVGVWVVLALLVLPLAVSAQQGGKLDILNLVNGTLDASTPTVTYTFSLGEGFIFSLSAWNRSGDLQIAMTLLDGAGTVIAESLPVGEDSSAVAIEAITVPASTTYTVKLSAISGTSGEYALILIPGYGYIHTWDEFEGKDDDLSLTWDEATTETETGIVDGRIRVYTDVANTVTWLVPDEETTWSDLYLEADITVDGSPSYFEYGFLVRVSEEDAFYMVSVASDDTWSANYFDGENWTTLQQWTDSPVLNTSSANPRIGLFVKGDTFTLFFNDEFVGSVTDPDLFAAEGSIALTGATTADQTDPVAVYFDNLIITTPEFESTSTASDDNNSNNDGISGLFGSSSGNDDDNGAEPTKLPFGLPGATKEPEQPTPLPQPTETPLPPKPTATPETVSGTSLETWRSDRPQAIVNELLDLGLVPAGGSLEIDVPNSFGDTSSSGFSYYPLASGRSFQNFVIGFDAELTTTGSGSGCGMHFRNSTDSRSLAMIMEDGSALLTQINSGEFHDATIFDVYPSVIAGQGAVNRVLVIALEETVGMYVNGELIGVADFNAASGGVALELYVQADDAGATQRTYCQLSDVWLWEF